MAGQGFVLYGEKMTSDQVVYSATQGTRADGYFYASIGASIAKHRRVEIVNAWEFARDRLMKAMGYAANQLTLTQTELVCKVPLANVKGYTIVKQATTVAPEAANLNVGFSWKAARTGAGTVPDPYVYPQGRPQQLGTVGLDAAVNEIIHAYLRMNSKD